VQYRELSFKQNLLDIRIAEGKSIDAILSSPAAKAMIPADKTTFVVMKNTLKE
jgi:hypothetical protein